MSFFNQLKFLPSRTLLKMRISGILIVFMIFVQPVWASTPYTCFTEEVSGISNGEFVNPEVAPFKINVSDNGVNFVANSFFQNLSMFYLFCEGTHKKSLFFFHLIIHLTFFFFLSLRVKNLQM